VLELDYIKGLSVRTYWRDIEKKEKVFDWSYFDQAISMAKAVKKPVMLRSIAGAGTPDYVYDAGAETYQTLSDGRRIPSPWDEVFQFKYQKFIRAFGERYNNNPNVVLAHVSPAAGGEWAEIHVPETLLGRKDFTEKKLLDASIKVIDNFAESFSSKSIGVACSPMRNDESYHLAIGFVDHIVKKWGEFNPKFYLSDHGLCERGLRGSWMYMHIWDKKIRRGLQMIGANTWPKGPHNGSYITSSELALKYDACYVEVYEPDIMGTPDEADIKFMAEKLQKHWQNKKDK
jgi:hypothetical protein